MKYLNYVDAMRKFGLISLGLCLGTFVFAQYNTRNEWSVGLSAGANASTITTVPKYVDKMLLIQPGAGLSIRYISEDHFGIQLECNYVASGWREDAEGNGLNPSYERSIQFIELPFLLHAYSGGTMARYFLNIGPKIGYMISENERVINDGYSYLQHGKNVEKSFQYGVLAGLGVGLHVGKNALNLEGRFHYHLSNLFNDAIQDDFSTSNLQVISVHLTYFYQISK